MEKQRTSRAQFADITQTCKVQSKNKKILIFLLNAKENYFLAMQWVNFNLKLIWIQVNLKCAFSNVNFCFKSSVLNSQEAVL